jgi:hypothetical protein
MTWLSWGWVFKQFFDNHELFNALLDYYNKDLYRFEFKSIGRGTMPSSSWNETASTMTWWRI